MSRTATPGTVLIAGAGLAGSRCAETLRAGGFTGRIVLAADEPHPPYERPALSKELLTGARAADDLALRPRKFWTEQSIELRRAVHRVEPEARSAELEDGRLDWDALVVATGARPRRLPDGDLEGIHYLRTLADAEALRSELAPNVHVAVIGAGFVGTEVASSAREIGARVTLVEMLPQPFAPLLGAEVAERLVDRYREHGVRLRLGRGVRGFAGANGRVQAIELENGERLACDVAVVGVGVRPSAELVEDWIPLARDGAVPTDTHGGTAVAGVYACGDVASPWDEVRGCHSRLEHWTAAASGAAAVARTILGHSHPVAQPPYFWSDQFGWRLQMVGQPQGEGRAQIEETPTGFVVRYRGHAGDLHAGLAVNTPGALASLRRELAVAGAS